jgi:hypothetical protein
MNSSFLRCPAILAIMIVVLAGSASHATPPITPHIDLREILVPSPLRALAPDSVVVSGKAEVGDGRRVRVRVTTSLGDCFEAETKASGKHFACRYPQDFAGAPSLSPMLLYVDATDAAEFGGKDMLEHQAEALLIVSGSSGDAIPDLPLIFTDDLVDARGSKDTQSAQWPRSRTLVNLFMHGRGARLMGIGRPDFDMAKPADIAWFKEHATLYDFDHRDRDWRQPLGNRVARGFWQAEWNAWFNPSNDHPWDGNADNHDTANYRPYAFANDIADLVVLYQIRRKLPRAVADNRDALADEALKNVLAMQHRGAETFALRETSGQQEYYTAGAFRYGMFATGEWLTEGRGWFANPQFRDFVRGGVLNGRCVWALAESLKAQPDGPLAARICEAIVLTLRFCLHDGIEHKYTRLTPAGRPLWGGIPGEHAYLLLGMLAAAEAVPELPVQLADDQAARPLRAVCVDALDALTEIALADGTWSHYANVDAMNIAALATGARVLFREEGATRWKAAAARAADVWIALTPLPDEHTAPTPLFGHRKAAGMTYYLGSEAHPHMALYVSGLWLQALADLHAVTHDARYADRAHAVLAYYCGNNPLHARILNEIGGVNNRITDADDDGIEEDLQWNAYPESTAFVQIGLLHCLNP